MSVKVLYDSGVGAVLYDSETQKVLADLGGGCPCQPTHMSISWTITDTGDPLAGEPTFNLSFTSEADIPDLIPSGCVFSYFDCRTFVEGNVTGCLFPIFAENTCCFELSLYYDFDLGLWVVSFDIIFHDHAIKCGGFEAWPHPDSCGVSIDGSSGTRTFECPSTTIDEALTNGVGSCPHLSGHGTVDFT